VSVKITATEFRTHDQLVLRGQRQGDGDRWVLLVHEEGQDLDAWGALPRGLAGSGFTVLTFDLRGHGASDDPWDPATAGLDVLAAISFAQAEGAGPIGLVGSGIGATACLEAAAVRPMAALVAISAPAVQPAVEAAQVARCPKLFIVGSWDEAARRGAQELHNRCLGWALLSLVPVPDQGAALLASDWGDSVRASIESFLRNHV